MTKEQLIAEIKRIIKQNGNKEITGDLLQVVLVYMVEFTDQSETIDEHLAEALAELNLKQAEIEALIAQANALMKSALNALYNVSQINDKYDYAANQDARNAVPVADRKRTQTLIYRLSTGEIVTEQFTGDNVSGWGNSANWTAIGIDKNIVLAKAEKKSFLNISHETDSVYNSRVAARNAVPTQYRKIGSVLTYTIGSGVKETNFTKLNGASLVSSTGVIQQTANDAQNMVVTANVLPDMVKVDFPIILTGGDNGGAFYNENGVFISGFKFANNSGYANGDRVPIAIPTGAKTIKTTYKNDANLGSFPPFNYFQYYGSGDIAMEIVIEQFRGSSLLNWGVNESWETITSNSFLNTFLIGERNNNIVENVTDAIRDCKLEHRQINVANGSITEDLNRDISVIYMYEIPIGKTVNIQIPYPSQMAAQPAIHIYNNNHVRINTIEYNDTGKYAVVNNYNQLIKISFYCEVTGSGTIPNFNIIDSIFGSISEDGENAIKEKNGKVILNNIDKLLYYTSETAISDITKALKNKIKSGINIEVATGVLVNAPSPGNEVVQMLQLKPSTKYTLSGFQNTWTTQVPFAWLYNKLAGDNLPSVSASKTFVYGDLKDGVLSFSTDDVNTKLSLYTAYKGTTFPVFDSKDTLVLTEVTESDYKIVNEQGKTISVAGSGGGGNDLSNNTKMQFPTPLGVARVNIEVDVLPQSKGDKKPCVVNFISKSGIYFTKNGQIDIQGSTSASNPTYLQKNYSIVLFNDDGSECDFRIGDTVFDTDAHLKCDWMESSHNRNIGICNLVYQYDMTKEYPNRLPFEKYYTGYETGARCIVTGFPFEMYINGVWWGLYTWNLRFNRKNFNMKKGNANQILMKCGNSSNAWQESTIQVNDEYWDIKNPSSITEDTKATIMRLFNFLRTQNAATYKAELHNYMDIDSVLEYFIYIDAFQLIDNFIGNLGLCTYDGVIWYALVYDADTSLGLGFWGQSKTNPMTSLSSEQKYSPSVWFPKIWSAFQDELKVKYADMRKKVLNYNNVCNQFIDFEKKVGAEIFEKDLAKWTTKPANTEGLGTNANQICTYYKQRLVYLDNKYQYTE